LTEGSPDNEQLVIRLEISDSEADEIVIKQPMLGMSPYVLILPEYDSDEDRFTINISACDLGQEALANLFSDLADTLREQR
jgi:hypothetical protein